MKKTICLLVVFLLLLGGCAQKGQSDGASEYQEDLDSYKGQSNGTSEYDVGSFS